MSAVVQSIQRDTDIMGKISSASAEQSTGIAQVGEAVAQMDQAAQQNAALVEEMAADASSLKSQVDELVHEVSVLSPPKPTANLRKWLGLTVAFWSMTRSFGYAMRLRIPAC